jgi:hypothetical protein
VVGRFAEAEPLHGPLKASIYSLADHAALKLGKGAGDLKHQLAGGLVVSIDCCNLGNSSA